MSYVNAAAHGGSDGTSWTDAYRDLQDALDDARNSAGCPCEIWIAAGTYKPDRGTGDQRLAFELFGSIALYGGFGGWEECRDQRDPGVNITILSGDLGDDDDLLAQSLSDCCDLTPPFFECSDPECRADVAAIEPECAQAWGRSCRYRAIDVCCNVCRPTRCDNAFNVVRATQPGSAPVLDGLTIRDGEGFDSDPQQSYGGGGGLVAMYGGPRVTGCRFLRNRPGAAFFRSPSGTLLLESTSFVDNGIESPPDYALTIWNPQRPPTLKQLSVTNNLGGGMLLHGFEATITDSTFRDNGHIGLFCNSSDCTVVGSQFVGNGEGGVLADETVWIIDSLFLRNLDTALFTFYGAVVINSVFAGNTSSSTGGLSCGSAYVLNSVFYGNTDGAMAVAFGGATIRNSIFWGNYDESGGFGQNAQFYTYLAAFTEVDHSIVHGWTGSWSGIGNSGSDPLFIDPLGPDGIVGTEDDDLRLSPGSPAINAGDPNTLYLPPTDLDGHARVLCGRVDIGAYEFGIGDYTCDQTIDLSDFANWSACMTGPLPGPVSPSCTAFDFNADQSIDLLDFAALQPILAGQ